MTEKGLKKENFVAVSTEQKNRILLEVDFRKNREILLDLQIQEWNKKRKLACSGLHDRLRNLQEIDFFLKERRKKKIEIVMTSCMKILLRKIVEL